MNHRWVVFKMVSHVCIIIVLVRHCLTPDILFITILFGKCIFCSFWLIVVACRWMQFSVSDLAFFSICQDLYRNLEDYTSFAWVKILKLHNQVSSLPADYPFKFYAWLLSYKEMPCAKTLIPIERVGTNKVMSWSIHILTLLDCKVNVKAGPM